MLFVLLALFLAIVFRGRPILDLIGFAYEPQQVSLLHSNIYFNLKTNYHY
jgi:hypothetical protein